MEQHLIVVEGEHDQAFLTEYLGFLDKEGQFLIETTDKKGTGGNGKLPAFLKQLAAPYQSLSIIFDADESHSKTHARIIKQINDLLNKNPLENFLKELLNAAIKKNNIFLFPDNHSSETIEDLLLDCAKEPDFKKCAEEYLKCLQKRKSIKQTHKVKYSAYMAAMRNYSKAYQDRFEFSDSALEPLKQFLLSKIL